MIDRLNEKVRTGEFLPSMRLFFFEQPINSLPFKYRDGSVHLTVNRIENEDDNNSELDDVEKTGPDSFGGSDYEKK